MKSIQLSFVLVICVYLLGCASGAKMENMEFQGNQKTYPQTLKDNIEVAEVSGGKKTNPAWTSQISNEAFSGALKNTLISQGLFSVNGKYQLDVQMIKVEQPMFGFDLQVITEVRYTLSNRENSKVVMEEVISAPYTATVSDSFVATDRLRLANEGSAKQNIEYLLNKLSELKIDAQEISLAE